MKKIILPLLFLLLNPQQLFASEFPVKIKPVHKISTSNLDLKEGDSLEFVTSEAVLINSKPYINKGELVTATVTSLEDNGYLAQPAKLYLENFRTVSAKNTPIKLKGIIYKSGNDHRVFGEVFTFQFLRGGEVHITPEKDEFTIYVEENL